MQIKVRSQMENVGQESVVFSGWCDLYAALEKVISENWKKIQIWGDIHHLEKNAHCSVNVL